MRGAFAMLTEDSPARKVWPDGKVPVLNFFQATPCELQGYGKLEGQGIQDCYLVDLRRLSPEELDRAVAFMAEASGADPAVIRFDIVRDGKFPLRKAHVASTGSDLPFFL